MKVIVKFADGSKREFEVSPLGIIPPKRQEDAASQVKAKLGDKARDIVEWEFEDSFL